MPLLALDVNRATMMKGWLEAGTMHRMWRPEKWSCGGGPYSFVPWTLAAILRT
jgi:hypothetical protein